MPKPHSFSQLIDGISSPVPFDLTVELDSTSRLTHADTPGTKQTQGPTGHSVGVTLLL